MRVFAYIYADLRLETPPSPDIWGWEVDTIYRDLSPSSAASGSDRPQLQRLLAESSQSPPDYLLVRRLEELGESLLAVANCLEVLEARGTIVIAIEQDYRSSIGEERQDLIVLWHEVTQSLQRRRLRQGHARSRIAALPPPGKAPYGYRRGKERYIIDRATAPVVKGFFEQFLLYGSLRQAVRFLEKKYGKKISVSTGQRWLTNPTYRGDLAYGNGSLLRDTHAAILSRQEAAQVDRLLRRNRRLPPRTASAPRSLAGLVTCKACSSRLKVSRVKTHQREYLYLSPKRCNRQPKCQSISYDSILRATIDAICQGLPDAVANLAASTGSDPSGSLNTQIQAKRAALEQLPGLVDQGILDRGTYELRQYQLRSEIAALEGQLSQLPPVNLQELAQSVSIPQFWLDLSESERRFFFREFIAQIYIERDPAPWRVAVEFIFAPRLPTED